MDAKQELGKIGEEYATQYLIEKGYQIIQRNFQCRQGEIDIIAQEAKEYVFIEVKTRQNLHYGRPVEAVTKEKQKHIWKVAKYYLYTHQLENQFVRFDVIEILKKGEKFYLNHIKQI